jgi:signal transduction histidine kinase
MTRRLVLAILGVTVVALATTWLGLLVLSGGAARESSVDELTEQGLVVLDTIGTEADDDELERVADLLYLSDATTVQVDVGTLEVTGRLPDVLRADDLDREALVAGKGRSGTRGDTVFVALPTLGENVNMVSVLVLTRPTDPPPSILPQWLALTSVVALAIGTAVALSIASRITRPVVDASRAAARISTGERSVRLPEPAVADRDELAELARSINDMAATIERADELERQFLLSVSHDLRTPLTSIRGYAEALATGSISDVDWATSVICREADRLDRLVRDLLDLARLDARSFSVEVHDVDLADAAEASVDMMLFQAQEAEIDLRTGVATSVSVAADSDRIMQIVGNLIDNALKFAASEVIVSVETDASTAYLHVDDDGAGIHEPEWPLVFERHFTTNRNQQRGDAGTGLGLALVAQLAAAFGGKATVGQSPSSGARFTVSLPVAYRQAISPTRSTLDT